MDPFNNKPHSYSVPSETSVRSDFDGARKEMLKNAQQNLNKAKQEIKEMRVSKEQNGSRAVDGVIQNEMLYTDFNTLQVPQNYKYTEDEYGYSMIPPTNWYPVPPHPPVCVSEKQAAVCPVYTEGTNLDLKLWHQSRRITPPDRINTDYVKDKLNSGR